MKYSLLTALLLLACGPLPSDDFTGSGHRPPPDSRLREIQREEDLKSSYGQLSQEQVEVVMEAHRAGFDNCLRAGAAYISGVSHLRFLVNVEGQVERVHVERSSMGSLAIEECLVQAGRFLEFPKPSGQAAALFLYPIHRNLAGTRLSQQVEESWGYRALRSKRREIEGCRQSYKFRAPFHMVAYIARPGRLLSAGFQSKQPPPEGLFSCVLEILKETSFPNPGRKTIKYRALLESLPEDR